MFMGLYDSAFGISWVPTLGPAFCYCTWILFEVGRKWNDDQHISTHINTKPWTILDIYGLSFVWGFHVMAPFYPDLSQGERVKPLYRGTDHDVNPVPESNKIAGTQAKPLKTAWCIYDHNLLHTSVMFWLWFCWLHLSLSLVFIFTCVANICIW